MPPAAALGDSFRSFFDALGEFVSNLASVSWGLLLLALLLHGGWATLRTRAWFNTLRAAYPHERFRWREIWGSYFVAVGLNSVVPARAGDVAKLYLARRSIPNSTYPAIGAAILVEVVFDVTAGLILIGFALTQGVFPSLPDLPKIPAFDIAYLAEHPQFALFMLTFLAITTLTLIGVLSVRVRSFWERVRQGFAILRDRERYLREVASLQALAGCLRFASFWLILEAFHIGASVRNVLLVMAVQILANAIPLTPNGAGAQQALLAVVFAGAAAQSQVAAYSVGQQVAIAVFNVAVGFAALALVFRTTDWRGIVRRSREEREAERTAPAAEPAGPGPT